MHSFKHVIFLQVCKALCPFYHNRSVIASKQDTAFLFEITTNLEKHCRN